MIFRHRRAQARQAADGQRRVYPPRQEDRSEIIIVSNMKKKYMKPEQHIIVLQHQHHLLAGSERNLRSVSGPFDYGGSDEGYEGDVR